MNCDKYGIDLERFHEFANCYTREEIAKGVGCDTSTVTKHYNGDRPINLDFAIRYAKFFDVSLDYLVHLSNEKMNAVSDEEIFKRNMVDYSGFSLETIEKMREVLTELINSGTATEDEILSYAEFYNKFIYMILDSRTLLFQLTMLYLDFKKEIKTTEEIKNIVYSKELTADLFPTYLSRSDLLIKSSLFNPEYNHSLEYKKYLIQRQFQKVIDNLYSNLETLYISSFDDNLKYFECLPEDRKSKILEYFKNSEKEQYGDLYEFFTGDGEQIGND